MTTNKTSFNRSNAPRFEENEQDYYLQLFWQYDSEFDIFKYRAKRPILAAFLKLVIGTEVKNQLEAKRNREISAIMVAGVSMGDVQIAHAKQELGIDELTFARYKKMFMQHLEKLKQPKDYELVTGATLVQIQTAIGKDLKDQFSRRQEQPCLNP